MSSTANTVRLPHRRVVLENGVVLVFAEQAHSSKLFLLASIDAGARCEERERAGIAQLAIRVLEEGSERYPGQALSRAIEGVGGTLEADGDGLAVEVNAEDWALAIDVLSDALLHSSCDEEAFERQQELQLSEIQAELDEPRTQALLRFRRMVYGDQHPFGRPTQGNEESVALATLEDVQRFHAEWFAPARCVVVVSGRILDPARLEAALASAFGAWSNPGALPLPPYPELELASSRRVEIQREDRSQVNLYLGHLGVRRVDPRFPALMLLDHVLGTGSGFTDRLSKRLRDDWGLAYSVYATISSSAGREPGTFLAYIGTSPDKVQQAIDGMLEEFERIRREAPSPAELELAKSYLLGSWPFRFERNSQRARWLLAAERLLLPSDEVELFPERLRAVQADEVLEAARACLHPEGLQAALVGPIDAVRL
ncbi:MAG: insulinase family protein [Planctomycetes bacterium]|nr:insulinase family protein [Planctomycetota bacterium]